ncbi:MAG: ComEC/Rec2 family competence protein, partial [Planctomycetes bacterium]|nr:ComEC/Rec2 family competence protein [Planctomycetota bacterium]
GDERSSMLLTALLVGERDGALRTLNRAMVHSGVAHFLSISGLHLGVFLGFVYLLCRLLVLSPRRAAAVVLVVLAAYILLAEPRAPLLRSAIMAASLCLATILGRRHFGLNALALAAVVLLVIDPLQLFTAAFQLSFVIVGGIILFQSPVRGLLFGWWLRRRGLMVFRDSGAWRRWSYFNLANWLIGGVSMCVTAYVVAAPLVAYHFGLFCPYAPLLSVLLLPLVLGVLIPGYLAMALAWPMPNLSNAIGSLAGEVANVMATLVESVQSLPGMFFELAPIGVVATALCYAAMLTVMFQRRIRFARIWVTAAVLAASSALIVSQLPSPAPRTAELHLLAVGPGQCAVLRTAGGKTCIIDAGSRGGFDVYDLVLGAFLRARKLPDPTWAFISHANSDHYNAMPGLLKSTRLETLYLNEYFGRARNGCPPPEAEQAIFALFLDRCDNIVRLASPPSRAIRLDDRTCVEILWPPGGRGDLTLNDTSLVLRITCDDQSVLLPGDLSRTGQGELARSGAAVRADVLVLPHHGAWCQTLPQFVSAVSPEMILVSSASDPVDRSRIPDETKKFFSSLEIPLRYYNTARNGWVCLKFGRGKSRVECMKP